MKKFLLPFLLLMLATPCFAEDQYKINPGDIIEISVWDEENMQRVVKILPDGTFSYPLIGIVDSINHTPGTLQTAIAEKLSEFFTAPEVLVTVNSTGGNVFYVLGNVAAPGMYPMPFKTNVIQALAQAGGLTTFADEDDIKLIHTDGTVSNVSYASFKKGEQLNKNLNLHSGDVIIVP